jgi:hypothetical protein
MNLRHDIASAAAQAVPSASLVGAQAFGYSISEWGSILAMAFIALQAAHLVWVWRREARARKGRK